MYFVKRPVAGSCVIVKLRTPDGGFGVSWRLERYPVGAAEVRVSVVTCPNGAVITRCVPFVVIRVTRPGPLSVGSVMVDSSPAASYPKTYFFDVGPAFASR